MQTERERRDCGAHPLGSVEELRRDFVEIFVHRFGNNTRNRPRNGVVSQELPWLLRRHVTHHLHLHLRHLLLLHLLLLLLLPIKAPLILSASPPTIIIIIIIIIIRRLTNYCNKQSFFKTLISKTKKTTLSIIKVLLIIMSLYSDSILQEWRYNASLLGYRESLFAFHVV